jgi:hypothetical protein
MNPQEQSSTSILSRGCYSSRILGLGDLGDSKERETSLLQVACSPSSFWYALLLCMTKEPF